MNRIKKILSVILAVALIAMEAAVIPAAAAPAYPHEDDVTQSVLYGKSALFVGDSITFAVHDEMVIRGVRCGWAGRIGEKYGMNWVNNGVSGTLISTQRPDLGRIVSQLKKAEGQSFDYVILHGGINDAGYSTPAGEVSDSFNPEDFDISTYAGGLEELICTAVELFGVDTHIGYLTTFRTPNHLSGFSQNMEPYYSRARAICEKWGIACYDMYNDDALNEELDLGTYAHTRDFLHPNTEGYNILAPYIANWMETIQHFDYVSIMGKRWEQEAEQAGALDPQYFTPESYAALQEALANEDENLYNRIENLWAVANELQPSEVPQPFRLRKGNRYYTVLDLYGVGNAEDFAALAEAVNAGLTRDTVRIVQTADVDLAGTRNLMVGASAEHPFAGTYDGRNFTLKNALITRKANNTALFPYLRGTLRNLTIENAAVYADGGSAIAAARTLGTENRIENVHLRGCKLIKSGINLGGGLLLCQPDSDADSFTLLGCTVADCEMDLQTEAWLLNMGLMVGKSTAVPSRMENCYSFRNTMRNGGSPSLRAVGGLLGESGNTAIVNCGAAGNRWIGEFTDWCGGLVGKARSGDLTLTDCYTDGEWPAVGLAAQGYTANRVLSEDAGDLNAAEIWNGALAYRLGTLTGNHWVQKEVPMVAAGAVPVAVTLQREGENIGVVYTDWENLVAAAPEELLAYGPQFRLAGEIRSLEQLLAEAFPAPAIVEILGAGDVNMDGRVDLLDALWILRYLAGKAETLPDPHAADVTADGEITTADVAFLLRTIAE